MAVVWISLRNLRRQAASLYRHVRFRLCHDHMRAMNGAAPDRLRTILKLSRRTIVNSWLTMPG